MTRYSADDPKHHYARVYLDGVLQTRVIECDTKEGWIERCRLDDTGQIFADGESVATEVVWGRVTVVLAEVSHG